MMLRGLTEIIVDEIVEIWQALISTHFGHLLLIFLLLLLLLLPLA